MVNQEVILEIKDLRKYYSMRRGLLSLSEERNIIALDGITFSVKRGETLGLVGESGSGKSTLARLIMRLEEASAGTINFEGGDITHLEGEGLRSLRKKIQIIFQDPQSSLNPRIRVGDTIAEPLRIHRIAKKKEIEEEVLKLLNKIGLGSEHFHRYPHELSSGQRQRIGIARALSLNPLMIIADEPISALDLSIKAQIMNLLLDLQAEYSLTYLFISHDLLTVKHLSDRIAVIYLGKLMELGNNDAIYENPLHPYTKLLLSSSPSYDPRNRTIGKLLLPEADFSLNKGIRGCPFYPRCNEKKEICLTDYPPLIEYEPYHWVACHLFGG